MTIDIQLRDAIDSDYPQLFAHRTDATSLWMAAFGTRDPDVEHMVARWKRAFAVPPALHQTIVQNGEVVGAVAVFLREGQPEVTYCIARSHWGRGIASAALAEILRRVTVRPIFAGAARDNVASLRVLQKCGFVITGSGWAFAPARGTDLEEVLLELR